MAGAVLFLAGLLVSGIVPGTPAGNAVTVRLESSCSCRFPVSLSYVTAMQTRLLLDSNNTPEAIPTIGFGWPEPAVPLGSEGP